MQCLQWIFEPGIAEGVVTRLRRNEHEQHEEQTLVLLSDGILCPILGSTSRNGLSIGPGLEVDGGAGWRTGGYDVSDPAFDPYSGSILARNGHAIYRLTGDDNVELVAGQYDEEGEQNGCGGDARLDSPRFLCTDGCGRAFCRGGRDNDRVVRLQLPDSWRTDAADDAAASSAAAAGPADARVQVTMLPFEAPDQIWGLAHVPGRGGSADSGSLILASYAAVYRLPLEGGEPAGALELLAGSEGAPRAIVDGRGRDARFGGIKGLAVCGDGSFVLADAVEGAKIVRRLAPAGDGWVVTSLTLPLHGDRRWCSPAILPNGYLALCGLDQLLVLDLGLEPPPLALPAEDGRAAGPPRRTLHADMGALLDAQPDGTADLILVVGDRRFHAHRAILSARSDYFKQRLAPERFADGAAAELSLPDADPVAFELLLRFLYTGSADIPSSLAPSAAELADRLLLPELCSDAQAVVLSGVCAATVVGSLLWADRLGGSFSGLLSSLKAWYLEHHEEVHEAAPESLERLSVEGPKLMVELHLAGMRGAKRRRTG